MALVDDMTSVICKFLKENGYEPELEKGVGQGKRVDVYVKLNVNTYDVGIEIKTSKEDLKTGYGRNFCFFTNYIAVPKHLVLYTLGLKYLNDIPKHVGVLAYVFPRQLFLVENARLNPEWGNVGTFAEIPDIWSPFSFANESEEHALDILTIREAM